jgi:hypothetical protein
MPDFDSYAASWTRWISAPSTTHLTPKAPIRAMFTAFKDFYSELAALVPEVTYIQGRRAFLHRARVAREREDVQSFRALRNEAIRYWDLYLDREKRKKEMMNKRLGRMLDEDVYPASGEMGGEMDVEEVMWRDNTAALQWSGDGKGEGASGGSSHRHQNSEKCSPTSELVSPKHQIDLADVGCCAHVNMSADWYAEPGPSTKKRRVDSGFSEMVVVDEEPVPDFMNDGEEIYAGKGKGKMGVGVKTEFICIE